jgi:hypothetical protein
MRSQDRFRLPPEPNRAPPGQTKVIQTRLFDLNGAAKTASTEHSSAIKCAILPANQCG